MNGLIIASYVLKTQQQLADRNFDYAVNENAHTTARRALVSLAVSFASLSAFVFALDVLK
jgi:hypothetical protein